jgi:ATP-dependent exoDNAse (exonuclease V) beta subunit
MCYGDLDEGDPSLGVVQRLQGSGYIEWICPSTEEIPGDPPEDLEVPVNPLFNEQSGNVDRIARLIAMRVKSLIEGKAVRIKSAEGVWISQECAPVKSDEIMILMATRSGIRDALLRELSEYGINAHADQEGDLFERPAASVIEALFQFCARPHSKHHAAWVLRSPLIGLSDNDLDKFILAVEEGENLMQKLALFLKQTPAARL